MGTFHKLSNLIRVLTGEREGKKREELRIGLVFFPLLLVLISTFICVVNYKPGTFLSGWDTLHPEFNFKVYWDRIFFGVWQEHQGLGAVASQTHAAEIPRILILQLLNLFLPISFLRYAYFFLCLLLGPLGVYFFIDRVVLGKLPGKSKEPFAFLGALVYLLNLSTLQQFYVPLEMFATHFASLGWFCYFASKHIVGRSRRTFLYLFLVSFFSAPMAHTSTLWYAFFLVFSGYSLLYALHTLGFRFRAAKAFASIIFVLIISNAFWILPNVYFAVNHGVDVQNSKIHRLFSQEAFLQNREFGNLKSIALLKNFLFNWGENVGDGRYGALLDEWSSHLDKVGVKEVGYGVFALSVAGIFISIVFKKYRHVLPVIFIFGASYFFIANTNPPFDRFFALLQGNVPLFKEALRFPFTKFSIMLSFSYAVFFSVSVSAFYTLVGRACLFRTGMFLRSALIAFVTLALVYYMLPMFRGNLISTSMKIAIPHRYFDMFNFFSSQKENFRIATFPVNTMFGWQYYDWDKDNKLGYQGAGFLWFGIRQPIMDREFDRWFPTNEQYYREMSYAVYSTNPTIFSNLLNKYNIRFLILDESIMAMGDDPNTKALFIEEIKSLFNLSGRVLQVKDFGEGLYVFEVIDAKGKGFVYAPDTYAKVHDPISRGYVDVAYNKLGDYITGDLSSSSVYYPLRNIYSIGEEVLSDVLLVSGSTYKINILNDLGLSGLDKVGIYLPTEDFDEKALVGDPVYIGNTALSSSNNRLLGEFENNVFITKVDFSQLLVEPENCFSPDKNQLFGGGALTDGIYIKGKNTISCLTYPLIDILRGAQFGGKRGYFVLKVSFNYSSLTRETPMYCLLDRSKGTCLNNTNKFFSYSSGKAEDYVFLSYENVGNYYLRFMLDSVNSSEARTINYQDITLTVSEPSKKVDVGVEPSLPTINDQGNIIGNFFGFVNYNYDIKKVKRNLGFCGFKIPLEQSRVVETDNSGGSFIAYKSRDGFLCDFFLYPNLPHAFGYILEIRSKNVSGLPLRLCFKNNVSGRCDLYISLPENEDFATNYYLVPSGYYGDYGYSLDFVNLSYGNLPTENLLQSVRLLPFPYDYISNISYVYGSDKEISHENNLNVISSDKLAIPIYKVRTEGEGVLVLGQSYEEGWIMLHFGVGGGILPHYLVNSWANGWSVTCGGEDESGCRGDYLIVFWPQILEFLGLISLAIFIFFKLKTSRIGRSSSISQKAC